MSGVDEALVEKVTAAIFATHEPAYFHQRERTKLWRVLWDQFEECARAVLEAVLPDLTAEHRRQVDALNEHADEIASQRNAAIRDADARVAAAERRAEAAEADRDHWREQADSWARRRDLMARKSREQRARAEAAEERLTAVLALAVNDCNGCFEPDHPCGDPVCDLRAQIRALASTDGTALARVRAEALREAADAIQALHPGEVKNSVIFLRERADHIEAEAGGQCDNYTGATTCLTVGCTTPCNACREAGGHDG